MMIPPGDSQHSQSREFFALPYEEKMKSEHPPESNPHRGYSWVGQENLSSLTRRDRGLEPLKETKVIP